VHDVIVNAIADADICAPALELAAYLATTTTAPILNRPERVLATSRVENAARLSKIDGLRVARTQRIAKERISSRMALPYLLRAPGFHNGANFEMIADRQQEDAALAALPGDELLAIEYLETRGADGAFRKYRAMAVDGVLYPAHLAIGEVWKLHYFSASMNDARRAEEASYLSDMPKHLGERAYQTLAAIVARIGLDYCGMDFTVDAAGDVALFEANASMTVYLPDDTAENAYRRKAVFAIDAALASAIRERVGSS
jgi:hypothetical protein